MWVRASREELAVETAGNVFVIDDDEALCRAVGRLLRSVGLKPHLFSTVREFLGFARPEGAACLVLDVQLPGLSGLDLQSELTSANIQLPIVFISGHGDIPMTVQAMKRGAIEFLTKPFRDQDLLDAINLGLRRDRARLDQDRTLAAIRQRFEGLTVREREVMLQVVRGRLNKQIAADFGISEVTVKVHRSNLKRKMKATSVPALCRMAEELELIKT